MVDVEVKEVVELKVARGMLVSTLNATSNGGGNLSEKGVMSDETII